MNRLKELEGKDRTPEEQEEYLTLVMNVKSPFGTFEGLTLAFGCPHCGGVAVPKEFRDICVCPCCDKCYSVNLVKHTGEEVFVGGEYIIIDLGDSQYSILVVSTVKVTNKPNCVFFTNMSDGKCYEKINSDNAYLLVHDVHS